MITTILYIEDHSESIRLVRKILEKENYKVLTEWNAILGVLIARTHRPDLILMDINLPWIDGVKALESLRLEKALLKTPVIAVTANAGVGDRERYLESGFDGYVPKPISRTDLLDTISALLKEG